MNKKESGLEWFNKKIKPLLGDEFELKYVHNKDGDLGDLSGFKFDSNKKGGYIYFWSSGYVGFQLIDYDNELEIVEDTIEEVELRSYDEVFNGLLLKLK